MPSQPPIPPLLYPYLSNPRYSPQSLTLITSVLAATSNWLVLRYIYFFLFPTLSTAYEYEDRDHNKKAKRVILVSFLRDGAFWRGEAKRLGMSLSDRNRVRFVDGLSGLFDLGAQQQQQQQRPQQGSIRLLQRDGATGSGGTIPMRGPGPARPPQTMLSNLNDSSFTINNNNNSSTPRKLHISGSGITALNKLEAEIVSEIISLKQSVNNNNNTEGEDENDILLILDQPDFVLASTPGIDANDMSDWVMGLQQQVHSVLITTSADFPLIHNANPSTSYNGEATSSSATATSLEKNHAAFVVGLAHRASLVLQLRTLDTGAAKDVSGVLRMSKGGKFEDDDDEKGEHIIEKEVLYFVQRDGSVKVFGRGEV